MKSIRTIALALALLGSTLAIGRSQTVTGLDSLNYWGTGTNHAGLVISFNDGKTNSTIAWGFAWNGTASVASMLTSLAAADPRLFARIDSATGFGLGIFGLGYDANGNGIFSVTGAENPLGNPTTPVFTAGISDLNTNSTTVQAPASSVGAAPGEIADHYTEGWNDNGFWELFTGGASSVYPTTWTSSMTGATDTNLVNNGWFALSISNSDFSSNIPGAAVAAVPEPDSVALVAGAGGLLLLWSRRRRHA